MKPRKIALPLWMHKALILDRQTRSHQLWGGAGHTLTKGIHTKAETPAWRRDRTRATGVRKVQASQEERQASRCPSLGQGPGAPQRPTVEASPPTPQLSGLHLVPRAVFPLSLYEDGSPQHSQGSGETEVVRARM